VAQSSLISIETPAAITLQLLSRHLRLKPPDRAIAEFAVLLQIKAVEAIQYAARLSEERAG